VRGAGRRRGNEGAPKGIYERHHGGLPGNKYQTTRFGKHDDDEEVAMMKAPRPRHDGAPHNHQKIMGNARLEASLAEEEIVVRILA
jgi:hypothetical protein